MKCVIAILLMLCVCFSTGCSQFTGDNGQGKYTVEQLLPLIEQASATTTRIVLSGHSDETLAKVRAVGEAVVDVTKDGVTVDDLTTALNEVLDKVLAEQNLNENVAELIRFVFEFATTMAETEITSKLEPILENEKVKVTAQILDAVAKGVVRGATPLS